MDYRRVTVKLAHKLKLDWERPEYQRASVRASVQASSVDGTEATATFVWLATGTGGQCSSRIGSFAEANALLELPAGKDIGLRELAAGTTVQAIFFRDIFE